MKPKVISLIRPFPETNSKLLALADVEIDGVCIRGFAVFRPAEEAKHVAFPQLKYHNGPSVILKKELRQQVQAIVFRAYMDSTPRIS